MHGGADGSGAPRENGNYKHGRYTELVQASRGWLREATQLLRSLGDLRGLSLAPSPFPMRGLFDRVWPKYLLKNLLRVFGRLHSA